LLFASQGRHGGADNHCVITEFDPLFTVERLARPVCGIVRAAYDPRLYQLVDLTLGAFAPWAEPVLQYGILAADWFVYVI
jgi:hypothetical protein